MPEPTPDPCQLFVDAVAQSTIEVAAAVAALEAALQLLDDRLQALDNCRAANDAPQNIGYRELRKWVQIFQEDIKQVTDMLQDFRQGK